MEELKINLLSSIVIVIEHSILQILQHIYTYRTYVRRQRILYVNKRVMSRIGNNVPLRRIRKVCRGLRYLVYRTSCSSTNFEGTDGDAA